MDFEFETYREPNEELRHASASANDGANILFSIKNFISQNVFSDILEELGVPKESLAAHSARPRSTSCPRGARPKIHPSAQTQPSQIKGRHQNLESQETEHVSTSESWDSWGDSPVRGPSGRTLNPHLLRETFSPRPVTTFASHSLHSSPQSGQKGILNAVVSGISTIGQKATTWMNALDSNFEHIFQPDVNDDSAGADNSTAKLKDYSSTRNAVPSMNNSSSLKADDLVQPVRPAARVGSKTGQSRKRMTGKGASSSGSSSKLGVTRLKGLSLASTSPASTQALPSAEVPSAVYLKDTRITPPTSVVYPKDTITPPSMTTSSQSVPSVPSVPPILNGTPASGGASASPPSKNQILSPRPIMNSLATGGLLGSPAGASPARIFQLPSGRASGHNSPGVHIPMGGLDMHLFGILLHEQSKGALEATAAAAAAACTTNDSHIAQSVTQNLGHRMHSKVNRLKSPVKQSELEPVQQHNVTSQPSVQHAEGTEQQKPLGVISTIPSRKSRACLKSLLAELATSKRDRQSLTFELEELREKNELLAGENSRLVTHGSMSTDPLLEDSMRCQLEALLQDKTRLMVENARLESENRGLQMLLAFTAEHAGVGFGSPDGTPPRERTCVEGAGNSISDVRTLSAGGCTDVVGSDSDSVTGELPAGEEAQVGELEASAASRVLTFEPAESDEMLQQVRRQYSSLMPSPSDLPSWDYTARIEAVEADGRFIVAQQCSSGSDQEPLDVTQSAAADSTVLVAVSSEGEAEESLIQAPDSDILTLTALPLGTEKEEQQTVVHLGAMPTFQANEEDISDDTVCCSNEVQPGKLQESSREESPCLGDMHAKILLLNPGVGSPTKIIHVASDAGGYGLTAA
ncbi:hypothetical protein CEUSTIGMA_g9305.t1 [Chlamydomonas eustigma]|uniref:Uncharacterized protein n=1 Tax=Chlamydomonas eustigma TaxID=1157962 RepID=A0A250XFN2_9CHLO|nr:hypothetical protein CEUSTIGMA_g9305.t1 [Chlamydomonas eustigma]|eukprot:GAX81877.1 hypothetical protein CEUSTIGMA_g9305.t1 [Chlamydomonas eustigma]